MQVVALQQRLAHVRENACIDVIALGQVTHGAREVARLPRVDHDHRVSGELKRGGHVQFESACGFQNDQADRRAVRAQRCQTLDQRLVPHLIVVQRQRRVAVAEARFQRRLGHVHTDGHRRIVRSVRQSRHRPSFYVRSWIFMQLFGLKTSGRGRAPKCLVPGLADNNQPPGSTGCTPLPNRQRGQGQAVDLWTMR